MLFQMWKNLFGSWQSQPCVGSTDLSSDLSTEQQLMFDLSR